MRFVVNFRYTFIGSHKLHSMKKTLSFTLLCFIVLSAVAQVPFPPANAVWTERHGNSDAAPDFAIVGLLNVDEVIGGHTYHKLFRSTNDLTLDTPELIGGLREDASHHVYFYDNALAAERLLYDFYLSPGDTIFTGPGNSANGIVDIVDTVSIDGIDRRRLTFRQIGATIPWTSGAWVEGIGNTGLGGLLGSPMMQPTCDCGVNTVCYSKDGAEKYHNPVYLTIDCDAVFATSFVNHTFAFATTVSVFPNPLTKLSHLQIAGNAQFSRLSIYNVLGKSMREADVTGVSDLTLDKNDFAPGMYIYHLRDEAGHIMTGKFVVE
jgi:hypothetical protein